MVGFLAFFKPLFAFLGNFVYEYSGTFEAGFHQNSSISND